ncbi:hypothetical protein, partial [Brachybacterium alimentarium]
MALPTAPSRTSTRPAHAPSTRLASLVTSLALVLPSALALQVLEPAPAAAEVTDEQLAAGGVLRDSRTYQVAPGLDLTNFSRLEEGG